MKRCNYNQVKLDKCPICESPDLADLFEGDKKYFLNNCSCEFSQKYCICKKCSFVFTQDPLDEASLKNYYENDLQERRGVATSDEKVHMQAQFDFLLWNGVDIRNTSVLEIGAGNGTFLDLLCVKGADKNRIYYDELSSGSKEVLSQKDYKSLSIEEVVALGKKDFEVDLVVMNHTLEHLVSPLNKLSKIYKLLSEAGYLYIEVPDFTFDSRNTDNVIFQHVNYFSENTLQLLLEKVGFLVVATQNDYDEEYAACRKNVLRILATKGNQFKGKISNSSIAVQGKKPMNWIECRDGFCVRELCRKQKYEHLSVYLANELLNNSKSSIRVAFWTARSETCECLASIDFSKYNVVAIFDRNKNHWHKKIFDIEIMNPETLNQAQITHVIIPNEGYEADIKKDLRNYGFTGKVIGWSDLSQMF